MHKVCVPLRELPPVAKQIISCSILFLSHIAMLLSSGHVYITVRTAKTSKDPGAKQASFNNKAKLNSYIHLLYAQFNRLACKINSKTTQKLTDSKFEVGSTVEARSRL